MIAHESVSDRPPTVRQMLDLMLSEREEWDDLLDRLGEPRMELAGLAGDWSVKDLIAHITWFEREMVTLIRERTLNGSELWLLPPDERNAAIYREYRHLSIHEVLAESRQVFASLDSAVQTLSDADLIDPSRFTDMPPDWEPWRIIADNSYAHYMDHKKALGAWVDKLDNQAESCANF